LTLKLIEDRDGFDETLANPAFDVLLMAGSGGIKIDVAFRLANRFAMISFSKAQSFLMASKPNMMASSISLPEPGRRRLRPS
jgi:hypothetical protein